jgi:hypothetical protein
VPGSAAVVVVSVIAREVRRQPVDIGRGVHPDRAVRRQQHPDAHAVLQRPELLEALRLLERRRREARIALEKGVAEHVDPHVPERHHQAGLTRVRHRRAREVERVA